MNFTLYAVRMKISLTPDITVHCVEIALYVQLLQVS